MHPPPGRPLLRSHLVLAVFTAVAATSGCPASSSRPGDAGQAGGTGTARSGGSNVMKGIRAAVNTEPVPWTDAGPRTVAFASASTIEWWAADRTGLQGALNAVKLGSGEELARALEKHAGVPPELVARARAVKGREPVGEQADAALAGPLSLPVGGVHAPVIPARASLALASSALDEGCKDVLLRPGAVGQVLAGVGRTRVVLLVDGDDLKRFSACLDKATLPDGGDAAAAAELARLRALVRGGLDGQVAVLVGLGNAQ